MLKKLIKNIIFNMLFKFLINKVSEDFTTNKNATYTKKLLY